MRSRHIVRLLRTSAFLLSLAAAPALAGSSFSHTDSRSADGPAFGARLSSAQEVPDNASNGVARTLASFDNAFTQVAVNVEIDLASLEGAVTAAHFHCGQAGANGPIALGLINPGPLALNGNTIQGTLTNDDFPAMDSCLDAIGRPVNNVASLAAAMQAGLIYANIHTEAFPGGELRGQMLPGSEAAGRRIRRSTRSSGYRGSTSASPPAMIPSSASWGSSLDRDHD